VWKNGISEVEQVGPEARKGKKVMNFYDILLMTQ
jgi:hypothetical protein